MSRGRAAPSLLGDTAPALTVIVFVVGSIGWFAWKGLKRLHIV